MNKLIIALVVVLIGIQSWTLKTQQQLLEAVTPQTEIEVELENETNEKVNFASDDPEDFIKIMKGYCKFLATNTKVSTSVAKLLSEKRSQNAIENVNQEVHSKLYYGEIELLGKADVSNNLYMTYCFD